MARAERSGNEVSPFGEVGKRQLSQVGLDQHVVCVEQLQPLAHVLLGQDVEHLRGKPEYRGKLLA